MDDETLAPFVDALASALIMMVLVSIFFIIQTASSLNEAAKLYTVSEREASEEETHYSPINFRRVVNIDTLKNEMSYLLNFKFTKDELSLLQTEFENIKAIEITVHSNDSDRKSVVNLLRFIKKIGFDKSINVTTKLNKSQSGLSKITWELN